MMAGSPIRWGRIKTFFIYRIMLFAYVNCSYQKLKPVQLLPIGLSSRSAVTQSGLTIDQPVSITAVSGSSAFIVVSIAGNGTASYQWKFNGNNISNGQQASGSTIQGAQTSL